MTAAPWTVMMAAADGDGIGQHTYAKGSAQRQGLTAAIEQLQQRLPLEVPVVVGGKEVRRRHARGLTQPQARGSGIYSGI